LRGEVRATWTIPVAKRELKEITGLISPSPTEAVVEFIWQWMTIPLGLKGFDQLQNDSTAVELLLWLDPGFNRYVKENRQKNPDPLIHVREYAPAGSPKFKLYDDGWRLDPRSLQLDEKR
jgi:hypothetical protein